MSFSKSFRRTGIVRICRFAFRHCSFRCWLVASPLALHLLGYESINQSINQLINFPQVMRWEMIKWLVCNAGWDETKITSVIKSFCGSQPNIASRWRIILRHCVQQIKPLAMKVADCERKNENDCELKRRSQLTEIRELTLRYSENRKWLVYKEVSLNDVLLLLRHSY